jgi:hypothetical protein
VHRVRFIVVFLAVLTVLAGWPLEYKVNDLRTPRNQAVEAFLRSAPENAETARAAAVQAKGEFFLWHSVSLLLNFGTVALVTVAMALAARLPESSGQWPAGSGQPTPRREPEASALTERT